MEKNQISPCSNLMDQIVDRKIEEETYSKKYLTTSDFEVLDFRQSYMKSAELELELENNSSDTSHTDSDVNSVVCTINSSEVHSVDTSQKSPDVTTTTSLGTQKSSNIKCVDYIMEPIEASFDYKKIEPVYEPCGSFMGSGDALVESKKPSVASLKPRKKFNCLNHDDNLRRQKSLDSFQLVREPSRVNVCCRNKQEVKKKNQPREVRDPFGLNEQFSSAQVETNKNLRIQDEFKNTSKNLLSESSKNLTKESLLSLQQGNIYKTHSGDVEVKLECARSPSLHFEDGFIKSKKSSKDFERFKIDRLARSCKDSPINEKLKRLRDVEKIEDRQGDQDFVYLATKTTDVGTSVKLKCPSTHDFRLKLCKSNQEDKHSFGSLSIKKANSCSTVSQKTTLSQFKKRLRRAQRPTSSMDNLSTYVRYRTLILFLMVTHFFYILFVLLVYKWHVYPF